MRKFLTTAGAAIDLLAGPTGNPEYSESRWQKGVKALMATNPIKNAFGRLPKL